MTTATASPAATRAEFTTLGLVSAAHLVSHFYMLALVPILPELKDMLGVSYTDLAWSAILLNLVSSLTQAPIGFLCDRVGARTLLVAGLLAGGAAFVAVGLWPTYPVLLAAAVVIGLANAVYHPADYSILAAEISPAMMGRAFSVHSFVGYLGFAVAAPVMLTADHLGGARFALVVCGALGPLAALPFVPACFGERDAHRAKARKPGADKGPTALSLLTPAVIVLTVMYTTLNLGTGILQTYMIVALGDHLHMPRELANWSLSLFMGAIVVGVLAGGFLADKVSRQSMITSGALGLAAAIVALIGGVGTGGAATLALVTFAGFLAGVIVPSRDLLTRAASPPQAVGRVFGIVTTGFNLGGMIGPYIGAWFIDHAMPAGVFYSSAAFMAVTIGLAIKADIDGGPRAAA
jgi:MFS family permease